MDIEYIAIACVQENLGIGKDNKLPGHYPADLAYFKLLTNGYPLIMGRRTWESLPLKKLPGRHLVVVTSKPYRSHDEEVEFVGSIEEAMKSASRFCRVKGVDKIFVAGGQSIYQDFFPLTGRLVLTHIGSNPIEEPDTFFPSFSKRDWDIVHVQPLESDTDSLTVIEYVYKPKK